MAGHSIIFFSNHCAGDRDNIIHLTEDEVAYIYLVSFTVKNENEAYELYNDYAMKMGFSVKKSKEWHSV